MRRGPLFFAGDLTSSGSPFELALTRRVAGIGDPFVFVTGNHDSDILARRLAAAGAIVLSQRGRLLPNGRRGEIVVDVDGLRVAGYSDPSSAGAGTATATVAPRPPSSRSAPSPPGCVRCSDG